MNAYPTYHSPIRILTALGLKPDNLTAESLKLERKRLLLEIQLSETQTIQVGDKTISKNDVLDIFDEIKGASALSHHIRIFKNRKLLEFLENYELVENENPEQKLSFRTQEELNDFKQFVSPYLANAYDKMLAQTIRDASYDEFEKVLTFSKGLTDQDAIYAFRKFYSYCEFLEERLDGTHLEKTLFPFKDFLFLRDEPFYNIANEINKHYSDLGDYLASTLVNFAIDQHSSSGRSNHLFKIYDRLTKLNCSPEIKEHIHGNRIPFKRDTLLQITDKFGIGKKYIVIAIPVVLVIIFAILFGELPLDDMPKTPRQQREIEAAKELHEIDRLKAALDQQITIQPFSYLRKVKFDTTAFRVFHDSVYSAVVQWEFQANELKTDSPPMVISPLIVPDSSFVMPFGRKSKLWNETNSELLLIICDKNAISSYYIPAQDHIDVEIDPGSSVFFYAGNDWNHANGIQYKHPYKSSMSDSISIAINGSFNQISSMDLAFMRRIFRLKNGSSTHYCVKEVDGKYTLKVRKSAIHSRFGRNY